MPNRPFVPRHIKDGVIERDGAFCAFCGRTDKLCLDHVVPFSKGGLDASWNFRILCDSCNKKRGVKQTDDDYKTRLPVALWCTSCRSDIMPSTFGWCRTCKAAGEVAAEDIDGCFNTKKCGCKKVQKMIRRKVIKARRKRKRAMRKK